MTKCTQIILALILTLNLSTIFAQEQVSDPGMMVRIAEIEIYPEYLNEYKDILKEEAAASIKKEAGVIAIFPMFEQKQPHQVRIIEIYATKESYEAHLKTPHFQHYKTSTMKMVKSLKLVQMEALDKQTMIDIFKKL
ncbi:MAG: putative quinol monooxygenase [Chitinophagaceae bacterium]